MWGGSETRMRWARSAKEDSCQVFCACRAFAIASATCESGPLRPVHLSRH